jgi:hypothetical protein
MPLLGACRTGGKWGSNDVLALQFYEEMTFFQQYFGIIDKGKDQMQQKTI